MGCSTNTILTFFLDMHAKMFAGLFLTILLSISFLRSESQAKVVPGQDRIQRGGGPVRRDWPMQLTQDQKHLISQFLPHLYHSELAALGNNLNEDDMHFPNWMDFGRRSSEDQDGDA
ncbi:gastrin/cholecystokinin-like peptide [Thamnophis elegans]|uniref:gastrin/cholecystokinin-like peptide n=1 Tax=Thamnophis elegans TaxID=35005 RepID=UPI0013780459|nr:gastrin/cholecystokinin-like peptide [Thamnophis elegans]